MKQENERKVTDRSIEIKEEKIAELKFKAEDESMQKKIHEQKQEDCDNLKKDLLQQIEEN